VALSDVTLGSGDLQVTLTEGSVLTGERLTVERAPFLLRAPNSSVSIRDSLFTSGPQLYDFNRIVAPGDVTFIETTFVLTESPEQSFTLDEADRQLRAIDVVWNDTELAYDESVNDVVLGVLDDQTLTLDRCRFQIAMDVESTDQAFAVGTTAFAPNDPSLPMSGSNNRVLIVGPELQPGFAALLAPECAGCQTEP
jgi:hypothetical protein